jgi:superfamily II DNA helicase RecQ
VGTAEDKQKIVRQLTSGEQQVFTATNALGLGVDAPTIRAVVHVGTVRQIRQYAQESGRGGRDGKKSEAIIMRGYWTRNGRRVFGKFGEDVEKEMQGLIGGEGCMRAVLDEAMDGVERTGGCEGDEVACQRCREAREILGEEWVEEEEEVVEEVVEGVDEEGIEVEAETEERRGEERKAEERRAEERRAEERRAEERRAEERRTEVRREEARMVEEPDETDETDEEEQERERRRSAFMRASKERGRDQAMSVVKLEELMDEWQEGCQLCRARGRGRGNHELEQCQDEMADRARWQWELMKKSWQKVAFSCCYECWLPQDVCESFEWKMHNGGNYKIAGKACQYKGLIGKVFVAACVVKSTDVWLLVGGKLWEDGVETGDEVLESMELLIRDTTKWMGQKRRWGGIEGNHLSWIIKEVVGCIGLE